MGLLDRFRPPRPGLGLQTPMPPARVPRARADAVTIGSLLPVLSSGVTGLGTESDPATSFVPSVGRRPLMPSELAELATDGGVDRLVGEKPLWLWCAGAQLDLDGDHAPIDEAWSRLDVRSVFRATHDHALFFGGAGALIIPETPQPLHLPLRPGPIRALVPMSGYHLRVRELGSRPDQPRYRRPTWYQCDHTLSAMVRERMPEMREWWSGDVHWSHVLDFYGVPLRVPELYAGFSGWPAISIIQAAYSAIRGYEVQMMNNEAAGRRLSTMFMKHPDYAAKMMSDPDSYREYLANMSQGVGINNMVHSPPGGDLSAVSLSLSGIETLSKEQRTRLRYATGIPVEVLFEAAAGLLTANTTWFAEFATHLSGEFGAQYARNYRRLYDLMAQAVYNGQPPALRGIEPGDFSAPTDKERMEARLAAAQEGEILERMGAIPASAVTDRQARGKFTVALSVPTEWEPRGAAVVEGVADAPEAAPLNITPTDIASIVTVNEARASQGLGPNPAPDGNLTVSEYQARHAATIAAANAATGGEVAPTAPPAPNPTPDLEADADPVLAPDEIPDDTSAAEFAAQMTAHGFATCEHGKKNRCLLCGIERVREVNIGPNGEPIYPVKWRAITRAVASP